MSVTVPCPGYIFRPLLERQMDSLLCTESTPLEVLRRPIVRANRLLSRFSTRDNTTFILKSIGLYFLMFTVIEAMSRILGVKLLYLS